MLSIATAVLASAPIASATTLATFGTAGQYTWTVPSGITKVGFTVYGAQGGSYVYKSAPHTITTLPGGLGGEAKATFPVRPGEVFAITVGGHGANISAGSAGGSNGGGNGGANGAGGGGASDVRHGSRQWGDCPTVSEPCGLQDRFIVAGGGGGASTITGGGQGGGFGGQNGPLISTNGQGAFGQGGTGSTYGGGGGGGWFGGDGAARFSDTGASGQGGSGYISPFAVSGSLQFAASRAGDGLVVIKTA